jgi:hypothetical protein
MQAFVILFKSLIMYPSYYRKGSVCIKRETAVTGKQVNLDESYRNEAFRVINAADKKSFDDLISTMDIVSFETYERYLILLHKRTQVEAKTFRELHNRVPEFATTGQRPWYDN